MGNQFEADRPKHSKDTSKEWYILMHSLKKIAKEQVLARNLCSRKQDESK